jgi:hypothetical protein
MMFIWPKNQGNFEGVAGSTSQKFTAVIRPNKPWPSRVAAKIVARVVEMALCRMATSQPFRLANQRFLPATQRLRIC